jgi:molecular chaperone DnaK
MEVSMKLGQAIYEAQQTDAAHADAAADAKRSGDDVVDADYEEVKDEDDRKRSA